jgi:hypothetical protein
VVAKGGEHFTVLAAKISDGLVVTLYNGNVLAHFLKYGLLCYRCFFNRSYLFGGNGFLLNGNLFFCSLYYIFFV